MSDDNPQFWTKPVFRDSDPPRFTATLIGNALTVLYTGLQVSIQGDKAAPAAARTLDLVIPSAAEPGTAKAVRVHVRYFVHKDADSRVVLLLDVAGQALVVAHEYGECVSGDQFREMVVPIPEGPVPPLHAVATVAIQRRTIESNAMAGLDSLDITAEA